MKRRGTTSQKARGFGSLHPPISLSLYLSLGPAAFFLTTGTASAQTQAVAAPEGATVHLSVPPVATDLPVLVSDRRAVTLPGGTTLLRFPGVAGKLDPRSVQLLLSGASAGGGVTVLEQRFRYDLADVPTLLRRFIGQTVTLIRPMGAPPISGVLRSADDTVVLETTDGLLINPQGTYSVPKAPEGITATPTLEWVVQAPAGQYTADVRYTAPRIQGVASYRASLNAAGDRLTLRGWLELNNETGATFRNARVALRAVGEAAPFLTLPRPLDLPRGESRQGVFANVDELPVVREIVFGPSAAAKDFRAAYTDTPEVAVRLRNSKDVGLGVLLPSGQWNVWTTDAEGVPQSLPARILPAVPVDARLLVSLGPATALTGQRVVAGTRQLNPLTDEVTVQTTLTNRSNEPRTVTVLERLPVGAKVTESSVPAAPGEGTTVEFKVTVPPNGTAVVKAVVEVKKPGT